MNTPDDNLKKMPPSQSHTTTVDTTLAETNVQLATATTEYQPPVVLQPPLPPQPSTLLSTQNVQQDFNTNYTGSLATATCPPMPDNLLGKSLGLGPAGSVTITNHTTVSDDMRTQTLQQQSIPNIAVSQNAAPGAIAQNDTALHQNGYPSPPDSQTAIHAMDPNPPANDAAEAMPLPAGTILIADTPPSRVSAKNKTQRLRYRQELQTTDAARFKRLVFTECVPTIGPLAGLKQSLVSSCGLFKFCRSA